jgi:hypothetical protein
MDSFTTANLKALLSERETPCISIYLPTHRAMPDTTQDPIRYRNLINEAERQLLKTGRKPAQVETLLGRARALLDEINFWTYQSDGLAVFLSPRSFEHFRLPLSFKELLVVADHFHVKPILPLLTSDGYFYILALSQKRVRFYRATRSGLREIEIPGVPQTMEAAMAGDTGERMMQIHTFPSGAAGGQSARMFHGHGADSETQKDMVQRYFRRIDRGLHELLQNATAPLILAGVEYLHPLYRTVNSYKYMADVGVFGNPDNWSGAELHRQAWTAIQPHFERTRTDALRRFDEARGLHRASASLEEIVPAAHTGRVSTLFAATGTQQWGTFNPQTGTVILESGPRAGNEDLLNLATVQTLLAGGRVFALTPDEMPEGQAVAGVFRY